jgi:pSer/pThr/pTyr-binding forkhead associated (FHA) protein
MSTKEAKICPACQHENAATASICVKCKRVLSSITTAVTYDENLDIPDKDSLVSGSPKLRPGVLTLLFPGEANPLTMEIQDEMMLGRGIPGAVAPTIDLSPYSATVLGVSRNHALIKFEDGEATILDQGSSNGTWVNQKHIAPHTNQKLRSGDLLRLGNMLIFAYFSSAPPAKKTILLVNTSKKALLSQQQNLTLSDVKERITPYLQAIFEIQAIIDPKDDGRTSQAAIDYISWSTAHRGIQIRLQNVDELIEFLNSQLQPETPLNADKTQTADTASLQASSDRTATQAASEQADDAPTKETKDTATKPAGTTGTLARPRPSLQQLSQAFIARFAADMPEIGQNNLQQRLMPHLETLLESPFDLHIIRIS